MTDKKTVHATRKAGRPTLPKEVSDRVRTVAIKIIDRDFGGNKTRFGKSIGISQSAVSQLVDGGGASLKTAVAVAGLAGISPQDLLGEDTLGTLIQGRFPGLEACIAAASKRWKPATVAAARAALWPYDAMPEEWGKRLDALETVHSQVISGAKPPPSTPIPTRHRS